MRIASQMLLVLTRLCIVLALCTSVWGPDCAAGDLDDEGNSSRESRALAVRAVPFSRLSGPTKAQLQDVTDRPSYYRRMPSQQIDCDPQLLTFLVRRPEVMVNIWDMMGITKVSTRRVDPFSFLANDGVGTTCKCDLVYGDKDLHIYLGDGAYEGSMAPRKITGRCVCILQTKNNVDTAGNTWVDGTMDVFLKLDSFGADLLTRTIGPFVGKTADSNFVETAKFIEQVSQICQRSPSAAHGLASNLDKVEPAVQKEFAVIALRLSQATSAGLEPDRAIPEPAPGQPQHTAHQPAASPLNVHLTDVRPMASFADDPESQPSVPSPIAPKKSNVYMRR